MADGGKPLAEAKIKLSVEGAEEVRAQLSGAAAQTDDFAQTMGKLAQAEAQAVGTMQDHTKAVDEAAPKVKTLNESFAGLESQIKGTVGSGLRLLSIGTRLIGVAGVAVGAVTGVALAFKRLADEVNGVESGKGSEAAVKFLKDSGYNAAWASQNVNDLEKSYEALNARIEELTKERQSAFNAKAIAEAERLVEVWKQLPDLIEAARQKEESLANKAAVQRDIEKAQAEARAIIEAERLATMTEEEKHLARIAALEKARAVQQGIGGSAADVQAIIDRINAERDARLAAEKAIEDAKRKADEERAREQEQRDKERIDKEIAARKKAADDEANARIRAQQSVFDAARRESERSLSSIATNAANATLLLQNISNANQGRAPWL